VVRNRTSLGNFPPIWSHIGLCNVPLSQIGIQLDTEHDGRFSKQNRQSARFAAFPFAVFPAQKMIRKKIARPWGIIGNETVNLAVGFQC